MELELKSSDIETANGNFGMKPKLKDRVTRFFQNPRKRLVFIIIIGVFLITAFALAFYFINKRDKQSENETTQIEERLYEAVLDGVMTDQDSANRHPLAVIVENHNSVRSQSGLDKASIVYEAIAEGGITRFMPIFSTYESETIGPVRSARTFFVDWAKGYNAYFAHCGGNIDALDQIAADKNFLDLDQFKYPQIYWRDKTIKTSSEHTLFTSSIKLRVLATENGYPTKNEFEVYNFKDDQSCDENSEDEDIQNQCRLMLARPESQKITVNISSANYNIYYQYDPISNIYFRYMAGTPHNDKISGQQLKPKNIIVMTVNRQYGLTRINENGYTMTTVGEGDAKIYLDGGEIAAKWKKSSKDSREIFYDQNGEEIIFNRGQFWITVIPPESTVSVETVPKSVIN